MTDILTVSQLVGSLRRLIEADPALQDTWVAGEVSNMTRARSGHWYFTLKDGDAALRCVMWKSDTARQSVQPVEGDRVTVHGSVGVYPARGDVQFYADVIRAAGVGDLYAEFERLRELLAQEGLFADEDKQLLPAMPARIGVVTSADAAAYQDVLNVLRRRYPLAEVILSPSLVQGATAPPLLVEALQRVDGLVDVILLVRGGGSIEDLWAFNDEGLVRVIHAAQTPIVTGVGHETDFTLVDFVADQRAPTPSAAAEIATPNLPEIRMAVSDLGERVQAVMTDALRTRRADLESTRRFLRLQSPAADIRNSRQRVDESRRALRAAHTRRGNRLRERLEAKRAALFAASPQAILQRGYALVTKTDGTIVRRAADLTSGDELRLRFEDGEIDATTN